MRGNEALDKLVEFEFDTVLDIGSGEGSQADVLRGMAAVFTCDYSGADYCGDFNDIDFGRKFGCIWACHVLEHQLNVNSFLVKCRDLLEDGGVLAVTVPPAKRECVGGHLSIWNAGLLVYNLVMAGFNCADAKVKTYGYNISVIVRKKEFVMPELARDSGDLERLKPYLPMWVQNDSFNGEIEQLNW